jgi:hypothetical protein
MLICSFLTSPFLLYDMSVCYVSMCVCMMWKLVHHINRNIDSGCLWRRIYGKYLKLKGRKWEEAGEKCTVGNFVIYVCTYVYIYAYACINVCTYVCMHECMDVCM